MDVLLGEKLTLSSSLHPDYLTLGSGAIKGYYILGALHVMHVNGMLIHVKGYSGVSVGSMISLLMISGFTPIDIATMAYNTRIFDADFTFDNLKKIIAEAGEKMGIISDQPIRNFLKSALEKKYSNIPTLKSLYEITGIDFYSITYNQSTMKTVYLSHLTHPDMCCIDAVLLSINIPFLFHKKHYQNEVYIDGAFGDPLPIAPFDGKGYVVAIFVSSENVSDDNHLASYTQKIMISSVCSLKNMIMKMADPKTSFLEIVCPLIIDVTGQSLGTSERGRMLHHGGEALNQYIRKIELIHEIPSKSSLQKLLSDDPHQAVIYRSLSLNGDLEDL
ncbi:Patatin phospholipase [uncultured virus]|nr:Patatin phospholipase [uncultured virus]